TSGDHAGARRRGLHENASGAMLADHLVRNRRAGHRNRHHLAPGGIHGLAHRLRHLVRLARRDANLALPVAHRHECIEREATAALDDLRHAIDRDDVLDESALFALVGAAATALAAARAAAAATTTARPATTASPGPAAAATPAAAAPATGGAFAARALTARGVGLRCHARPLARLILVLCHLELQPAFAGAIGHRLDAAVVTVSGAVDDHLADPRRLRLLGDPLAHRRRLLRLPAGQPVVRHRQQRALGDVVHQLRIDVLLGAEHDEPRPFGRACHLRADTAVPPVAQSRPRCWNACSWHYFAPALPAFRRITSPA